MTELKHLKYYKNYIAEQVGGFDEEGNPIAPAPVEKVFSFLFLDDNESGEYVYPDGSSTTSHETYSISETELKNWLESNIVSDENNDKFSDNAIKVKKKNLLNYISGNKNNISPEDKEFLYKFKSNVLSEIVGKKTHSVDIIFPKGGGIPSSDSFATTFITLPKK